MRHKRLIVGLGVLILLLASVFLDLSCAKKEQKQEQIQAGVIFGFRTPESVAVGPDGKYYVSNIGNFNVKGDGAIRIIEDNNVKDFVGGLDDPKGATFFGKDLFVADIDKIWKIDLAGNKAIFLASESFPQKPAFLNDLTFDSAGNLYVSETNLGLIFKADPQGNVVIFIDRSRSAELKAPNGLIFDLEGNLLVADFNTGKLLKITPDGSMLTVIASGFGGGDGLAYDAQKNLYISDYKGGKIFKLSPDGKAEAFVTGFKGPSDITVDIKRNLLLVPEFEGHQVTIIELKSS